MTVVANGMVEKEDTLHGAVDARRGSLSSFVERKTVIWELAGQASIKLREISFP